MIYKQELASRMATYVRKLYIKYQSPQLVYHNLNHTQHVIGRLAEISLNYSLNETETFILLTAAWFHDCGHLFGSATHHELKSISIMEGYVRRMGVEEHVIQSIQQCIISTKFPNDPQSLLAEILCDADLFHLGTHEFFKTDELVRKEVELRNDILAENWDETTLSFLEAHVYFTGYCRQLLEKGKEKNIVLLREKIKSKS